MAYLLSNICTKNYWNQTMNVKIIIGGWVVTFFRHSVYVLFSRNKEVDTNCTVQLPVTCLVDETRYCLCCKLQQQAALFHSCIIIITSN